MRLTFEMFKYICYLLQICGIFGIDTSVWKGRCKIVNIQSIQCTVVPKNIPTNITRVSVEDFDEDGHGINGNLFVNSDMFSDASWKKVTFLSFTKTNELEKLTVNFKDNCFEHLTNLEELHIHVIYVSFQSHVFHGLPALTLLNLSGCGRMHQYELENALDSKIAIPNLEFLDISNVWNRLKSRKINLDSKFFSITFSKRIKGINLSHNQIEMIDGPAVSEFCENIDYINISNCALERYNASVDPLCTKIGVLDLSYTHIIGFQKSNIGLKVDKDINFPNFITNDFSTVVDIRLDGNIDGLYIYGGALVTIYTSNNYSVELASVTLRDNHITTLDVKIDIPELKIKHLDISRNELEFINPLVLNSSWQLLEHLELSSNKLNSMLLRNKTLFSQIASSYPNLKYIGFAANGLSDIPDSMFTHNHYLEVVDLSHNEITSFVLLFSSKRRLKELYLHNNNIHTLDPVSIQCLDSLFGTNNHHKEFKVNVTLDSNPISCSECEDHDQIAWIVKSSVIILFGSHAASCIHSNGDIEHITEDTAYRLQNICNQKIQRKKTIIFSSTFIFIFVFIIILVVWLVRRYHKRRKYERNMEEIVALIQTGVEEYEFTLFLSHCSEDELFVNSEVFDPLQTTLQELTNTDRPLICTGDINYRVGQWIAEETIHLLKRSSVVIIVVSNAYCLSHYCRMEFEQAYDLQKPMFPVMKDLYNRYTRILWEFEDGEYRLKTTWQNVGTSILEMMKK